MVFHDFVSANKVKEESNLTTQVEVNKNDSFVRQSFLLDEKDIDTQIDRAEKVVIGTVKEILPTVETTDLIDSGISEAKKDGYNFLHTDIVVEVDRNTSFNINYDEIVLRRYGGRLDNFVHVNEMEDFRVDENVLIPLLKQPIGVTQLPTGYGKDQYFILNPGSKYLMNNKDEFILEGNKYKKINLKEVRKLKGNKNCNDC